ncbi:MAG TPA: MFS transporter [Solirubrobacteraceae bacterium]|nr:MFS transporter [Solirubrobacteraceae bacterium]
MALTSARSHGRLEGGAAFAAAAYAFMAAMLGTTLPTPLYALYQRRFGFSELIITVIFATYALGVIVALLLAGRLSDEVGRRPVLLGGLLLSALSAVAFLLANGLVLLLVGRILSGLSAGIFTGTATATLVDLLGTQRAGRATLVAAVANMGGLGSGPLLSAALASLGTPLRLPFWVDLGLLVPALAAILLIREPVQATGRVRLRLQTLSVPPQMRTTFVSSALAGFAGFAVLGLSTAVAPAFLGQTLGVHSLVVVGLVVFSVFAGSTAGQLLLDVVPQARALSAGCAGLVMGMALLAVGLASSSLGFLVAGGVLAGVGQGLSFRAALGAINSQAPPERRGEVDSSFFVVAYVAISLPVIGEGVLAQLAGLRTAGLVFAAVVAVIAAIVLVLLARQRDQRG